MESSQLKLLLKTLDDIRHENGVEYWYARELYPILGYSRWENFETPLNKAKESCKKAGSEVNSHFHDIMKMVKIGLDLEKTVPDVKLTRYACYLIAINGNPQKEEIAFAQAYFVTQTRKIEVLEQRMIELERIDARDKLKITEKEFGAVAFSRGVDGRGIAEIRSFGDQALFGGKATDEMKHRLGVPANKPLADFLPNVTLKAKDLATAMTTENTRRKNLRGKGSILSEHVVSNRSVRGALTRTSIYPENLPATEDIKKIEAKHRKEIKDLEKRHKKELDRAARKLNR
ncbi:MAG TPA: DNA damage-inducible protein D [Candidatus Paceibacterota bacterium]